MVAESISLAEKPRTTIAWREKFLASAIHFLVTLALAAGAAALIFLIWFPDPFQSMVGGTKLFLLIVGCDLALGPLISLVIYNSNKPRRELLTDYAIVGVVQLAALVYGVYAISNARPAYVAFVQDRLEVVTAVEIEASELEAANEPYRTLPKWGPRFVGTDVPADQREEALFVALQGRDISMRPRFYVPYEHRIEEIKRRAKPLAELEQRHPPAKELVASALAERGVPSDRARWLPIKAKEGFWTALIDLESGYPIAYVPLDPY